MSELLAPAGDISCANAAIDAGADAIYLGLKNFSARASAGNFGEEELAALCARAHVLGVRVHAALNTLVKQSEVKDFVGAVIAAHNAGVDAVIIQDIFLGAYLKRTYPQLTLHLSTQAGVNNIYGARLAADYGFERVILARETPLSEIERIAKIIETEVFVQGALCTCFSGQCYLSSFAGGNSGNRGRCKQPCRKLYSIDREGFGERAYALSLSDLSVGGEISRLLEAGVYSFKIEGRMRRPEYVSAAVRYYRNLLDGRPGEGDFSALKRTYNRGNYTSGLAFGQDRTFISRAVQGHIGEYCGVVRVADGRYLCTSSQKCGEGDGFKVLRGGREVGGAVYAGGAKGGFYISSASRLMNGDKVFITTDVSLNESLLKDHKLKKINVSVTVEEGKSLSAVVDGEEYRGEYVPSAARTRAVEETDIVRCFDKVDCFPFEPVYGDIITDGKCFVPASALNAFRRDVYSRHFERLADNRRPKIRNIKPLPEAEPPCRNDLKAVIARDLGGVEADIGILKPDDYSEVNVDGLSSFAGKKYLFLPPFMNGEALEEVKSILDFFDGIYCDGYWSIEFCRQTGKELFAGCGFNLSNGLSLSQFQAEYAALSKELTFAEASPLAGRNTFYLSAGDIKVMDLIYCPFGRTCKTCDRRNVYTLTDEGGRAFPMRRYVCGGRCAFELYNCVPLVAPQNFTGTLADCTLCDAAAVAPVAGEGGKLKDYFKNYTSGHSKNPVL